MKNYCMTIEYDGTRYLGWLRLKDTDKSIQGKIEDVLSRMCEHKVEIHGSGRTDAGVHAIGQVASFKIETDKKTDEIRDYLNQYLPEDISVTGVREVDDRFHARLNACEKTYLYRINNSNISDVFERKYVYQVKEALDIEKMKKAAQYLLGTHDFVGFSSLKKVKKSTVRTVFECRVSAHPSQEGSLLTEEKACTTAGSNEVDIFITGDGFLYNMVRIIVGTLIEVGLGKKDAEVIQRVLDGKERETAGFTAPAQGLTLYKVKYANKEKGNML